MGGVNLTSLEQAEYLAFGWHYWFKEQANTTLKSRMIMDKNIFGTCPGLVKVPYMRDTRRSIGIGTGVRSVLLEADIEFRELPDECVYDLREGRADRGRYISRSCGHGCLRCGYSWDGGL